MKQNIKSIRKAVFAFCAVSVLASACKVEKIEYPTDKGSDSESGYLCMDGFNLQVADYAEEITSASEPSGQSIAVKANAGATIDAPDDYIVKIRSIKTGEEKRYTYGELKQEENKKLPLAPGAYVVSAESSDYEEYTAGAYYAEWNMPVYFGSVSKTIVKKLETDVNDLVCTLANIKATVVLTPDLQNLFMPDAECESQGLDKLSVTVSIGENSLVYDRTVSGLGTPGYFKAVENANTMKIILKGQYNKAAGDEAPEYVPVKWEKEITNCKAGQWRKISIGVVNSDQGNVQFQITVENWVYDEKVDVDVMSLYAFTEETIPDEDISDKDSPVVSIVDGDITQGYTISSSMYDEELSKWKTNLKMLATPSSGVRIRAVDVEIDSDNGEFIAALEAAGYADHILPLYPENQEFSSYMIFSEAVQTGVLSMTLTDSGMTELFAYKGNHSLKFIVKDELYRTSYTKMSLVCLDGEIVVNGPEIKWTDKTGTKVYDFSKRYNHDEVEILIKVSTQSKFTKFNVEISSDILTPGELQGVGLSDKLDLLNPGEYEESLKNLGFPVGTEVSGAKNVEFDITSFMGLISMLNNNGYCDFKLIVSDDSGTTERTIQLDVVLN